MTSLDHSLVHVLNKLKKKLCVSVRTFKRKIQELGQKWFKNQNVNAYYRFLGAHYFS
jgi:hypothetical protein